MIQFTVQMTDPRAIIVMFEKLTPELLKKLEATMEPLIKRVAAQQKARAPRGRTGRLATQVGHVFVDKGPDWIRARSTVVAASGWQFGKAGALEYGAPGRRGGVVNVSMYKRRGRGIGMDTLVDRYTRHARLVEHRYLRGPFEAMSGEIIEELEKAVAEAVAEMDAQTP